MAYEPFLPDGMKWWQLFDLVIVSACKPDFFSEARRPSYEIATPDGRMRAPNPNPNPNPNPDLRPNQVCCAR